MACDGRIHVSMRSQEPALSLTAFSGCIQLSCCLLLKYES